MFFAEGLVMEPADIFTLAKRDARASKKLAEVADKASKKGG